MIKIITVGKIKEKYLTDAINEYLKRLSKYTKINLIEVPDENFDITKTLETEKKSILKYISEKDYIITMEIEGKELSSIEFARKIDEIQISNSNICFIIGGSYGLSDEIKKMSNFKLSFSKMTFPHQLFRLILLEQIYRAYKINMNHIINKRSYICVASFLFNINMLLAIMLSTVQHFITLLTSLLISFIIFK